MAHFPPVRMAAGLLRREHRVLLCHRRPDRVNHPDAWDLTGGHIDQGESTTDALVRELADELGIGVASPEGPPWVTLRGDGRVLYVFFVDRWQGEPRNVEVEEHDDIRWTSVDDLVHLDLAHPS